MVILHALLRLKLVGNFARLALGRVRSCSVQAAKGNPLLRNFVHFRMCIARSNVHFTTITGQEEWVTTLDATLPSSTFETPDLPLVPTTIMLIL
jgi:hypothetical protein